MSPSIFFLSFNFPLAKPIISLDRSCPQTVIIYIVNTIYIFNIAFACKDQAWPHYFQPKGYKINFVSQNISPSAHIYQMTMQSGIFNEQLTKVCPSTPSGKRTIARHFPIQLSPNIKLHNHYVCVCANFFCHVNPINASYM